MSKAQSKSSEMSTRDLKLFESKSNDLSIEEYSVFLDTLLETYGKEIFSSIILNYFSQENILKNNISIKQINDIISDIIQDKDDNDTSSSSSESESNTEINSSQVSQQEIKNEQKNEENTANKKKKSRKKKRKKQKRKDVKVLFTNNPLIKYGVGFDKRPFIFVYIYRTDNKSSGGFVKRKYLIDSGAKRSSLFEDDAKKLKLLERGTVKVVNDSQKGIERSLVRVLITTGDGNGDNCWENVTSSVEITCNVRHKTSNIKRGILGADWLSSVRPMWPK